MGVLQQSWTDFCPRFRHRRSLHRKMVVSIKENAISHYAWDAILNKWEAKVYNWRRWEQPQLTLPKCMNQNSVLGDLNLSLIFGHSPKISNNGLYQLFYHCRVYNLETDWASWKFYDGTGLVGHFLLMVRVLRLRKLLLTSRLLIGQELSAKKKKSKRSEKRKTWLVGYYVMLCLVFSVISNFCLLPFFNLTIHGIKILAIKLLK